MDVRREQTRREYERRIEKAKNYIASNLREDIALRDIAAEAAFSEFHFHRIFSAFTGETIAHYIRRLRLEMGANRLQHDEVSTITAVGLECGFHNPAVFSRAFKERFGVTPELYRRGRRSMKAEAIPRIGRALRLYSIDRITITRFPSARVFFMSRVGPYDRSLVPLYRKVERHTRSIRAAGSFRMIGIPLEWKLTGEAESVFFHPALSPYILLRGCPSCWKGGSMSFTAVGFPRAVISPRNLLLFWSTMMTASFPISSEKHE
jgi:AraC-like DNA-binding protein